MLSVITQYDPTAMPKFEKPPERESGCWSIEEIQEHIEYYKNACSYHFEELGYETAEKCGLQKIALFDPLMCPPPES